MASVSILTRARSVHQHVYHSGPGHHGGACIRACTACQFHRSSTTIAADALPPLMTSRGSPGPLRMLWRMQCTAVAERWPPSSPDGMLLASVSYGISNHVWWPCCRSRASSPGTADATSQRTSYLVCLVSAIPVHQRMHKIKRFSLVLRLLKRDTCPPGRIANGCIAAARRGQWGLSIPRTCNANACRLTWL